MTGLVLTLHNPPAFELDCTTLNAATLQGKTLAQVGRLKLTQGRHRVSLGDLFDVSGDTQTDELTLLGVTPKLHRVGAGLASGVLRLSGNCGLELGLRMRGGRLLLTGNAGDGVGLGLRGGYLEVSGSAGDFIGGPAPGDVAGMNNGTIIIGRHAGARVGERMRRGLIIVGGDTGPLGGAQLIAGSIVLLGEVGPGLGTGMRRGSIVLAKPGHAPAATFNLAGTFDLPFMPLLIAHVTALKPRWRARLAGLARVTRWVGDASAGGMGEILLAS
ncbi:MAG: formylmethanofuran dehydrogenase subunit C [Gammaproteobacteria bacterium]|nr:formylmethanofuran dehydrogenase subunit C [Gammaproteobacteria bacterium]